MYISSTSLIIQLRFFQNFAFVIYISNIIDINTLLSPILQIIMVSDMLFMSTVESTVLMCFFKSPFIEYDWLQMSHLKFLLASWIILICVFTYSFTEKKFSQNSHLYLFSPSCTMLICFFKLRMLVLKIVYLYWNRGKQFW